MNSKILQTTAIQVCLAIICQSLLGSWSIAAQFSPVIPPQIIQTKPSLLTENTINPILQIKTPEIKNPPKFILINDIHSDPVSQRNIRTIIKKLTKTFENEGKKVFVGVEGAFSDLSFERYANGLNESDISVILGSMLDDGAVSGVSAYGLENTNPNIILSGVDDRRAYLLNVWALLRAQDWKSNNDLQIRQDIGELKHLVSKKGEKRLTEAFQILSDYYFGRLSLRDFLSSPILSNISLSHPESQNLIKGPRAELNLSQALYGIESDLIQSFSNERESHHILMKLQVLALMSKLNALQITPDELGRLRRHPDLKTVEATFQLDDAFLFYAWAEKRNELIFQNFMRVFNERKADLGILVTGGFHGHDIYSRLERLKQSCLLITPSMGPLINLRGNEYLNYFLMDGVDGYSTLAPIQLHLGLAANDYKKMNFADAEFLQRWFEQKSLSEFDDSDISFVNRMSNGFWSLRRSLIGQWSLQKVQIKKTAENLWDYGPLGLGGLALGLGVAQFSDGLMFLGLGAPLLLASIFTGKYGFMDHTPNNRLLLRKAKSIRDWRIENLFPEEVREHIIFLNKYREKLSVEHIEVLAEALTEDFQVFNATDIAMLLEIIKVNETKLRHSPAVMDLIWFASYGSISENVRRFIFEMVAGILGEEKEIKENNWKYFLEISGLLEMHEDFDDYVKIALLELLGLVGDSFYQYSSSALIVKGHSVEEMATKLPRLMFLAKSNLIDPSLIEDEFSMDFLLDTLEAISNYYRRFRILEKNEFVMPFLVASEISILTNAPELINDMDFSFLFDFLTSDDIQVGNLVISKLRSAHKKLMPQEIDSIQTWLEKAFFGFRYRNTSGDTSKAKVFGKTPKNLFDLIKNSVDENPSQILNMSMAILRHGEGFADSQIRPYIALLKKAEKKLLQRPADLVGVVNTVMGQVLQPGYYPHPQGLLHISAFIRRNADLISDRMLDEMNSQLKAYYSDGIPRKLIKSLSQIFKDQTQKRQNLGALKLEGKNQSMQASELFGELFRTSEGGNQAYDVLSKLFLIRHQLNQAQIRVLVEMATNRSLNNRERGLVLDILEERSELIQGDLLIQGLLKLISRWDTDSNELSQLLDIFNSRIENGMLKNSSSRRLVYKSIYESFLMKSGSPVGDQAQVYNVLQAIYEPLFADLGALYGKGTAFQKDLIHYIYRANNFLSSREQLNESDPILETLSTGLSKFQRDDFMYERDLFLLQLQVHMGDSDLISTVNLNRVFLGLSYEDLEGGVLLLNRINASGKSLTRDEIMAISAWVTWVLDSWSYRRSTTPNELNLKRQFLNDVFHLAIHHRSAHPGPTLEILANVLMASALIPSDYLDPYLKFMEGLNLSSPLERESVIYLVNRLLINLNDPDHLHAPKALAVMLDFVETYSRFIKKDGVDQIRNLLRKKIRIDNKIQESFKRILNRSDGPGFQGFASPLFPLGAFEFSLNWGSIVSWVAGHPVELVVIGSLSGLTLIGLSEIYKSLYPDRRLLTNRGRHQIIYELFLRRFHSEPDDVKMIFRLAYYYDDFSLNDKRMFEKLITHKQQDNLISEYFRKPIQRRFFARRWAVLFGLPQFINGIESQLKRSGMGRQFRLAYIIKRSYPYFNPATQNRLAQRLEGVLSPKGLFTRTVSNPIARSVLAGVKNKIQRQARNKKPVFDRYFSDRSTLRDIVFSSHKSIPNPARITTAIFSRELTPEWKRFDDRDIKENNVLHYSLIDIRQAAVVLEKEQMRRFLIKFQNNLRQVNKGNLGGVILTLHGESNPIQVLTRIYQDFEIPVDRRLMASIFFDGSLLAEPGKLATQINEMGFAGKQILAYPVKSSWLLDTWDLNSGFTFSRGGVNPPVIQLLDLVSFSTWRLDESLKSILLGHLKSRQSA